MDDPEVPIEAISEFPDLQTPDGVLPGIPIRPGNGRAPLESLATTPTQTATTDPCVACQIARLAALLVFTGVLIAILVIERRKAAKAGSAPSA